MIALFIWLMSIPCTVTPHTPKHEYNISTEQIQRKLGVSAPVLQAQQRSHDLDLVNSSVEKPPVNFVGLDESLQSLEQTVDDLTTHLNQCKRQLAELKRHVAQQLDVERMRTAQLQASMQATVHDLEEKNKHLELCMQHMHLQAQEASKPSSVLAEDTQVHSCGPNTTLVAHAVQAPQDFSATQLPDAVVE